MLGQWIVLTYDQQMATDQLVDESCSPVFAGMDVHGPFTNRAAAAEYAAEQRELGRAAEAFQAIKPELSLGRRVWDQKAVGWVRL